MKMQWKVQKQNRFLFLIILSIPLSLLLSVWGTELCYQSYDLHLLRRVKCVFTAWLEGTCSETCGDRRWSLTQCDHLRWHGGLKVCLRAAQLSAALLKTCSVSCGVSWPDEAGGTRAAVPSILQSVLSGCNASSGGSDYREGNRCFLRTSPAWGK